jgi:chromosome segregation ATPase
MNLTIVCNSFPVRLRSFLDKLKRFENVSTCITQALPYELLSQSKLLCINLKNSEENLMALKCKLSHSESELKNANACICDLRSKLDLQLEKLDALQEEKIVADFHIREAEGRVLENTALLQDLEQVRQQELEKTSLISSKVDFLSAELDRAREKIAQEEGCIEDLSRSQKELLERVEILQYEIERGTASYEHLEAKYKQLENLYNQQEADVPDPEVLNTNTRQSRKEPRQ